MTGFEVKCVLLLFCLPWLKKKNNVLCNFQGPVLKVFFYMLRPVVFFLSFFLFVCFYLGVVVMDMIFRKSKYFFSDHSSQSIVNLCFFKILSIALAILTFFEEFCIYLRKLKLGTVLMSFSDTSMLLLACVLSCYSCIRTQDFGKSS